MSWEAKEGCLALFGSIHSCEKIPKNAEKSCDLGQIGIVKPNKVKLEIFSKSFFTCFV